jgi:hypothetical protein
MTPEEARRLFDYDPESGELRWRVGQRAGGVVGTPNSGGRLTVWAKGKQHYVHRLIWLMVYGEWPAQIDHINLNRTDNRLANLRLCTPSQSAANRRGWAQSGFKGVRRHHNRWAAYIRENGAKRYLGTFDTPELANAAFYEAARAIHSEFARRT